MLLHIHPRAAEGDALCLQSKTLLQGGFSRQQDTAAGPHYPVPRQTVRGTGMQGPYHLARGARIPRQPRHCTIRTHATFRNSANHGQKSFEHNCYRYITSPSPAMHKAIPTALRALRCSRKKNSPATSKSSAVATLAISEARLMRQPAR